MASALGVALPILAAGVKPRPTEHVPLSKIEFDEYVALTAECDSAVVAEFLEHNYDQWLNGCDENELWGIHPLFLDLLEAAYDYECEEGRHCYAWYDLRTSAQDGKPDSDGRNGYVSTRWAGDGWWLVEYYDAGWHGMHYIRMLWDTGMPMMFDYDRAYDECSEYYGYGTY